jgi:hypothetical protein
MLLHKYLDICKFSVFYIRQDLNCLLSIYDLTPLLYIYLLFLEDLGYLGVPGPGGGGGHSVFTCI